MNASGHMNHDFSEPPPPAYSEQAEFDQKVSTALELSQQSQLEDDEWETYDPQAFEAAAAAYQDNAQGQGWKMGGGASTSMPQGKTSQKSTQPLRIEKKGAPPTDYKADTKKRDYSDSKHAADESQYGQSSSSSVNPSAAGPSQPYIYNECEGDEIAPPPFSELPPQAHQDPTTEFNPYEGFTPSAGAAPLPPAINVAPPVERDPSTSSQADQRLSPLYDLQQPSFAGPPPQLLPEPVRHQPYRQSLPSSPSNQPQMPFDHRPRSAMANVHHPMSFSANQSSAQSMYSSAGIPPTSFSTNPPLAPSMYSSPGIPASNFSTSSPSAQSLYSSPAGQPTLRFRPSIAYNKKATRQPYVIPQEEPQPQAFSAASFYNVAVASHLTPRPSASASYAHAPRSEQLPGSWAQPNRAESVYSMSSSYSDHTQSDAASQYGGFSQSMGYNWGNGYQR